MIKRKIKSFKIMEERIVTKNGNLYSKGCLNTEDMKESVNKYLSSHPEIISDCQLNIGLSQKGFAINEYNTKNKK